MSAVEHSPIVETLERRIAELDKAIEWAYSNFTESTVSAQRAKDSMEALRADRDTLQEFVDGLDVL